MCELCTFIYIRIIQLCIWLYLTKNLKKIITWCLRNELNLAEWEWRSCQVLSSSHPPPPLPICLQPLLLFMSAGLIPFLLINFYHNPLTLSSPHFPSTSATTTVVTHPPLITHPSKPRDGYPDLTEILFLPNINNKYK